MCTIVQSQSFLQCTHGRSRQNSLKRSIKRFNRWLLSSLWCGMQWGHTIHIHLAHKLHSTSQKKTSASCTLKHSAHQFFWLANALRYYSPCQLMTSQSAIFAGSKHVTIKNIQCTYLNKQHQGRANSQLSRTSDFFSCSLSMC